MEATKVASRRYRREATGTHGQQELQIQWRAPVLVGAQVRAAGRPLTRWSVRPAAPVVALLTPNTASVNATATGPVKVPGLCRGGRARSRTRLC